MTDKIATLDGALGPLPGEALATEPMTHISDAAAASAAGGAAGVHPAQALTQLLAPAALSPADSIATLAAALDAGRVDAATVLDLIVERALDDLGAGLLSPDERIAIREQVLTLAVADPHLAGLRVRLSGNASAADPDRGSHP